MIKAMIAVLAGTCISVAAMAQQKDVQREEIIIRKNGLPTEKMVIVIEGDSITVNGKSPKQAMLGVNIEKAENGVRIISISEGSAAEKAGLKEGDVIVSVNGKGETDPAAFRDAMRSRKPDEEVKLVVLPKGEKKEKNLNVKLGSMPMSRSFRMMIPQGPEAPPVPGAPQIRMFRNGDDMGPMIEREMERAFSWVEDRPKLGIRIQDTEASNGVTVLEVTDGSLAEKAGIKVDDLITSIDGKEIRDTDAARDALQSAREKSTYTVALKRSGKNLELQVQIPKKLKKATL